MRAQTILSFGLVSAFALAAFAKEPAATPVPASADPVVAEVKPSVDANPTPPPIRDPKWGTPVALKGAPNFHKVSDRLFRGAQPSRKGFKNIEKLGVKTVVNLRSFHSDRDELAGRSMGYEHIWMKAWNAEDEEIVRFLQIVTDTSKGPVFVHCQHGADRTGTMVAAYRVVVEGWTPEDAATEMVEGGYGFHAVWPNLVRYVKTEIDGPALRKQLGLPELPTSTSSP